VAAPADAQAAVTGRLRWRGIELAFAADGLAGIDGRLSAPSLALLTPAMQQVVLHHFADDLLCSFAGGPLGELTLQAIDWHEDPEPLQGEFAFTMSRPGVRGTSLGCLTVFDPAGRLQLLNALAAAGCPVPAEFASATGRLRIGTLHLSAEEVGSLEPGDLVWIDDAELSPAGLRAQFQADEAGGGCTAWLKRSAMARDPDAVATLVASPPAAGDAAVPLDVTSTALAVERAWLQGTLVRQRLPAPALALTWRVSLRQHALFEGSLMPVGRRLGLRVTRTWARVDAKPHALTTD
jgi:hypothetical protein